jgi:hypothetical protein
MADVDYEFIGDLDADISYSGLFVRIRSIWRKSRVGLTGE